MGTVLLFPRDTSCGGLDKKKGAHSLFVLRLPHPGFSFMIFSASFFRDLEIHAKDFIDLGRRLSPF